MSASRFADLSDDELRSVDVICEAFERALADRQPVSIEDQLVASSQEIRDTLFSELLLIELEYHSTRRDGLPEVTQYEARFPDRVAQVHEVFGRLSSENVQTKAGDDLGELDDEIKWSDCKSSVSVPGYIGRYRIDSLIGQGGFGLVYKGFDADLDRPVAIKIPHRSLVSRREEAELYLIEARTVAGLDHSNIVPVYDVGSTDNAPCFIVSKYVEGVDVAHRIKQRPFEFAEAAELVASVAEVLHYAHTRGLVHRDVKPGNILIDGEGKPHIVDFGLALCEENIGKGPKFAGTPHYMSPEQARGEGHRVDGRSDIFSLGVVLYELLGGRRPFRGATNAELFEQVANLEACPLRQLNDRLPRELDLICQKALAKRSAERYATASEFANELRQFLAEPVREIGIKETGTVTTNRASQDTLTASGIDSQDLDAQSNRMVPKGLRAFDEHDADFFLQLLAGPRDWKGLPASLWFWKTRIEEPEAEQTFSIGMIYGPSGCGKSSMVKAGLLPRLCDDVFSVYVESSAQETESRLLRGLQKQCPAIDPTLNLKDTLAALRQGQGLAEGKKILIVLDQFEQWLHGRPAGTAELVRALRQCDGGRVQCILMVRDDFWLAVTRFAAELEIDFIPGDNLAFVDLFDRDHARNVLAAFGQAFGKLPKNVCETTKAQNDFLDQSVAGLSEDGKVICVRLALLAEMMKDRPWVPATLKQVGGTEGIGVTFLEETFNARSAAPRHKLHQQAARAVLKSLLPASGTDIKGQMISEAELLRVSGYAADSKDFESLIRVLDIETRLITPTDPQSDEPHSDPVAGQSYYQLTHDFLVQSLRDWLTRKQQETRSGRAELLLAERSALWSKKPENRHLPSWSEHATIRLLSDKRTWTESNRQMLAKATSVHGTGGVLVVAVVAALAMGGLAIRNLLHQRTNEVRAQEMVASLISAEINRVPEIVSGLAELRRWANPLLEAEFAGAADGSLMKLRSSLALLPVDQGQIDYLGEQFPVCSLDQFPVMRESLTPYKDLLTENLWQRTLDQRQDPRMRFQASVALAEYAADDKRWGQIAGFVTEHLTGSVTSAFSSRWTDYLQSAKKSLIDPLVEIHRDRSRDVKQREAAAFALSRYLRDNPSRLVDVILVADENAEFAYLASALVSHSEAVKGRLIAVLKRTIPGGMSKEQQDDHWKRQAMAGVTLVRLGHGEEVWPLLRLTSDPSLRSQLIHHLGMLQSDHKTLADRLAAESDVSIRRALIQALGRLDTAAMASDDRDRIVDQLQKLFAESADPGIHGSCAWALRQWQLTPKALPRGTQIAIRPDPQEITELTRKVDGIRDRIDDYAQHALPLHQTTWEQRLCSATVDPSKSLQESLIAHYKLDEGAGETTASAIPGTPDGVCQDWGRSQWLPGIDGNAIGIDGDDASIRCDDAFDLERTDSFSYGCWFLRNSDERLGTLLAKMDVKNRYRGVDLMVAEGRIQIHLKHAWPGNAIVVDSVAPVPADQWHHVMVTYDGSSKASGVTIYLDGQSVLVKIAADHLSDSIRNNRPLTIGRRDSIHAFHGRIDEVMVFAKCLAPMEVDQIFQSGVRAAATVPAESRSADQQAFLASTFRRSDPTLNELQGQLNESELALRNTVWNHLRRWYVNSQGQTMALMPNLSEYGGGEIEHSFAISAHEVTVQQYARFQPTYGVDPELAPSPDCPVPSVNWFEAVEYCNWVSEQEGIPKDQWIYVPNSNGRFANGMTIKENFRELAGYRLPSTEEWTHACRATTQGTYSFGEPTGLLNRYARFVGNSDGRTHSVGSLLPNDAGLFDMHGNLQEWSQDAFIVAMSPVDASVSRMLLGGCFGWRAPNVGSNKQSTYRPGTDDGSTGFRLCRSYLLSEAIDLLRD